MASSSISNGLVLTTAMVVSTTVLYLAFSRQKTHSPSFQISSNSNKQILRSCLYSEEKRRERKKKRVKFAENVMVKEERDSDKGIKKEERKQKRGSLRSSGSSKCRNGSMEIGGMPENRVALYQGMLRDRGHRMACCH